MSLCFNQSHTSLVMITPKGYRFYAIEKSMKVDCLQSSPEVNHEIHEGKIRFIAGLLDSGFGIMVLDTSPKQLVFYDFKRKSARTKFCFPDIVLAAKISRTCIIIFLLDKIYVIKDFVNQDFSQAVPRSQISMPPNPKAICDYLALETQHFTEHFVAYPCYGNEDNQSSGKMNYFEIMDVTRKQVVTRICAHDHPVAVIAFGLSGIRIATACESGREIYVFDWKKGCKLHKYIRGRLNATISSVVFSKCGSYLVTTSNTETVHVFHLDVAKEEESNKVLKSRDISLKISNGFKGTGCVCAIDAKGVELKVMIAIPPGHLNVHHIPNSNSGSKTCEIFNLVDYISETEMVEIPPGQPARESDGDDDDGAAGGSAIAESSV